MQHDGYISEGQELKEKKKRKKEERGKAHSQDANEQFWLATVQTWDSEFDPYLFISGELLESPVHEYHSKLHCDVKTAFSLLHSVIQIQHNGT